MTTELYAVVTRYEVGNLTGVLASQEDGPLLDDSGNLITHTSSDAAWLVHDLTDGHGRGQLLEERYPEGFIAVFVGPFVDLPGAIASHFETTPEGRTLIVRPPDPVEPLDSDGIKVEGEFTTWDPGTVQPVTPTQEEIAAAAADAETEAQMADALADVYPPVAPTEGEAPGA